jgi:hypothetical protein
LVDVMSMLLRTSPSPEGVNAGDAAVNVANAAERRRQCRQLFSR